MEKEKVTVHHLAKKPSFSHREHEDLTPENRLLPLFRFKNSVSGPSPERLQEKFSWKQVLILVFWGGLMACGDEGTKSLLTPPPEGKVFFLQPRNNTVVRSPVKVILGAEELVIESAGKIHPGAGHLHILIDTAFIPMSQAIPFDAQHLHLGDGALSTALTLPKGTHILRLQFTDGAHIPLDGDQYHDEVTITVE
ncbi:DUF4399 domain-containing protein [Candidatus Poribacteria bacterium]|nr:DUF4399 domain-containing protein [Candidatus Poribacteria bacterium]